MIKTLEKCEEIILAMSFRELLIEKLNIKEISELEQSDPVFGEFLDTYFVIVCKNLINRNRRIESSFQELIKTKNQFFDEMKFRRKISFKIAKDESKKINIILIF